MRTIAYDHKWSEEIIDLDEKSNVGKIDIANSDKPVGKFI